MMERQSQHCTYDGEHARHEDPQEGPQTLSLHLSEGEGEGEGAGHGAGRRVHSAGWHTLGRQDLCAAGCPEIESRTGSSD